MRLVALATLATLALVGCADEAPIEVPLPGDLGPSDPRLVTLVHAARDGVVKNPDAWGTWAWLGHVYLANRWDHEAAACYRRAVELQPEQFAWHYFLGRSLAELDDVAAAAAFARAVELKPDDAPARFFYGEALSGMGRSDEARAQYEQAARLDPRHPLINLRLGVLSQDAGDLGAAWDYFEKALELNPGQSEVHAAMARVLMIRGEREAAQRHAEAARRPSNFVAMDDPLWAVIDHASAGPSGFFSRATRYLRAGQHERAEYEIEALVSGEQEDPTAWLYYAAVLVDLQRFDRAIEALERALEFAEARDTRFEVFTPAKYESAHTLLGSSLAASGDPIGAERALRRALEVNPESVMALRTLAAVYTGRGRETEARELLERARAIQIRN